MRNPDKDDRKKLRRLLRYLKRIIKLSLILRADVVNVLKWWMDASYAAHDGMRGHMVVTMSMGENRRGSIISIPKKQKLNTDSSAESEHIRAEDEMTRMIWTRYFLKS